MKLTIYAIYDSAAKIYNKPFYMINDAVALRTVADLVADDSTDIGRHPEHFTVFALGEYDDLTGLITVYSERQVVARCHELVGLEQAFEVVGEKPQMLKKQA